MKTTSDAAFETAADDGPALLPLLEEQRALVAHLTAERERAAGLKAALRESIQLFQERHRASSTATVTGEITINSLPA